jgi:hypothetical protein
MSSDKIALTGTLLSCTVGGVGFNIEQVNAVLHAGASIVGMIAGLSSAAYYIARLRTKR